MTELPTNVQDDINNFVDNELKLEGTEREQAKAGIMEYLSHQGELEVVCAIITDAAAQAMKHCKDKGMSQSITGVLLTKAFAKILAIAFSVFAGEKDNRDFGDELEQRLLRVLSDICNRSN